MYDHSVEGDHLHPFHGKNRITPLTALLLLAHGKCNNSAQKTARHLCASGPSACTHAHCSHVIVFMLRLRSWNTWTNVVRSSVRRVRRTQWAGLFWCDSVAKTMRTSLPCHTNSLSGRTRHLAVCPTDLRSVPNPRGFFVLFGADFATLAGHTVHS